MNSLLRSLLRGLTLLAVCSSARASDVAIVDVLLSSRAPAYQAVEQGLRDAIAVRQPPVPMILRVRTPGDSEPGAEGRAADLVVVAGAEAARRELSRGISSGSKPPLLMTWLSAQSYDDLRAGPLSNVLQARPHHVILLDQDPERFLTLIREVLPGARRVGVLLGPGSRQYQQKLKVAAEERQLRLEVEIVDHSRQLFQAIDRLLGRADVLLALPDPVVYNSYTLQSLIVETYRRRLPLIGFSEPLTRAGAAASLYTTPEQVGRQTGEAILAHVADQGAAPAGAQTGNRPAEKPAHDGRPVVMRARYLAVGVNTRVARVLGLDLPEPDTLTSKIEAREKP